MKKTFNDLSQNLEISAAQVSKEISENHLTAAFISNTRKRRSAPFSLRLSSEERKELERRAENAGYTIGGYCKWAVFSKPPPRRARKPVRDKAELARLLGEIGRIGNNLNQVTRQLHTHGSVDIPELEETLRDISELREAVMRALGYIDTPEPPSGPDGGYQRYDH